MACQFDRRHTDIVANLRRLFLHETTGHDIYLGERWYPRAHQLMLEWAETYHEDVAVIACVVSALSPQCEWSRNLVVADDVLAKRPQSASGPVHANVAKARRIWADRSHDISHYFPSGPKVAAFAANLAGDYSFPTIDTHAFQAALNDVRATTSIRWNVYQCFAECYIEVAHDVGYRPAIFQAVVWHTWKRLHPRVSKIQARTQWVSIGTE